MRHLGSAQRVSAGLAGGLLALETLVALLSAPALPAGAAQTATGYWEVAADGGVFAFGDAGFYGSWPGRNPQSGTTGPPWPIIGLVSSPDGRGYTLADRSGTGGYVFGDGDTCRAGPAGGALSAVYTSVAAAADSSGTSCWVATSDGGVFTGGSAQFYGSMGGHNLEKPIVDMALTPDGGGYWLAASDGGIFAFGGAAFLGSMGGIALDAPVVGMAAT